MEQDSIRLLRECDAGVKMGKPESPVLHQNSDTIVLALRYFRRQIESPNFRSDFPTPSERTAA